MASSSTAIKALTQEIKSLQESPVEGTETKLIDESNLFEWEVAIFGPPDTLYAGGYFKAHIRFPGDYPFSAPSFRFLTKIWHPNIYENGEVNQYYLILCYVIYLFNIFVLSRFVLLLLVCSVLHSFLLVCIVVLLFSTHTTHTARQAQHTKTDTKQTKETNEAAEAKRQKADNKRSEESKSRKQKNTHTQKQHTRAATENRQKKNGNSWDTGECLQVQLYLMKHRWCRQHIHRRQ